MHSSQLKIPGEYFFDSFQPNLEYEDNSPHGSDGGMDTDTDALTDQLEHTELIGGEFDDLDVSKRVDTQHSRLEPN